ncbi:serine/threonine-protein kinase [Roseicyclus sp. F158]|uniref:Serine/threonine-protein kinase n=1 Tax=Tropicimonas omnivorans TaxID=3075590 RepID=A0ABU3DE00_9RHOB|nr:serine/threonine-protein kinase [Roseicyclus sp. F158]MDT0681953.1 serine/threonine-protein kinase [Roseicyclus sp. F158]
MTAVSDDESGVPPEGGGSRPPKSTPPASEGRPREVSSGGTERTSGAAGVEIGTKIMGTFEITEHIATGGMGEVYRGVNIHTGEPVAIKIVLAALAHDEKILSLFQKEATVLGRLHHDAIVRYQLFTVDPGIQRACLVMEFVEGHSLGDYMENGPIPLQDVVVMLRRLTGGLQKAHDLGVVHRDLSPDNIIIQDGTVTHAKLIDFGIAKSENFGGGTLLGGQFAGKYGYVSPEQLGRFKGVVTGRSDIYSLGLVIAGACAGRPLDMGDSPADAVEKRLAVPDLSHVYPELRPLVERMLQPTPDDRPESMAQVLDYLDHPDKLAASAPALAAGEAPAAPAVPERTVIAAPFASQSDLSQPPAFGFTAPPQPRAPEQSQPPHSIPPGSLPPEGAPSESDSPFGASTAPPPAAPQATPPQAGAPDKSGSKGALIGGLVALILIGGGAGAYFAGVFGTAELPEEIVASGEDGADAPPDAQADGEDAPDLAAIDPEPETPPEEEPAAAEGPDEVATLEPETQPEPEAEMEAAPEPEPAPEAELEPAEPLSPIARVASQMEWVAEYELPSCSFATVRSATTDSFDIEAYGTTAAPFVRLLTDFETEYGFEPDIGVRQVNDSQCAVVGFMKDNAGGSEVSPTLTLDKDVLTSGEAIRGRIDQINGRPLFLMLVDAQGGTYDLTSRLRDQPDGTSTFAIALRPNSLTSDDGIVPQLIVAIASPTELATTASAPSGTSASILMRLLQEELDRKGETASVAPGYFRFDLE